MSKFLILGDLHFRKCKSKEESDYRMNVIDFISAYLKENRIDHVIQLGDFFHDRKSIDISLYNEVINIFNNRFNFLKTFEVILGNHDVYFNNMNLVHSLKMLEDKIPYIKAITEPEFSDVYKFNFLPWLNSENAESFDEVLKHKNKYCFGHLEINGFEMMRGIRAENKLDVKDFENFETVFSGHYHLTQQKNNIIYVGSVFQNDFGDYNDIKRFFIIDDYKNIVEEIKITYTFFDKVVINAESDIDNCNIQSYKDKNIQVVLNIPSSIKRENFITKISETLVNYNIIDNSRLCSEKIEISADEDLNNIFTEYLSQNKEYDETKRKSLQNLFIETYNKVINV